MFTNSKLAKSIRLAMAVASTGMIMPNVAFAQDAEESADSVEKISVTGSRIKRLDTEGANPVTIMDAFEIEKFGVTSIGDVLQSIPAAGSAINTNNNNGGTGATELDLRGLGTTRTLVLVNGRRWATGLNGAVDLNNIPSSIIERIEVLKDGASAVYGSDAVAGVVNIITRQDFEGAHASAYLGENDHGDGRKESYDIGFGATTDKSNVYFNVSYVKEEPTFAGDRDISAVPVFGTPDGFGGSSGTPEGRFFYFDETGAARNEAGDGNGGLEPWLEPDSRFNFAPFNYLSTPQERINIYTQGRYELTDNVTVSATAFYGNRKSAQFLAPTPLFFGSAFGDEGYVIAANNPYNPTGLDLSTDVGVGEPNDLYLVGRRMFEAGLREFKQDVDQFQFNAGFEGVFELSDTELYWDVGYTYASIQQNTLTDGLLNTDRVKLAIGDVNTCNDTAGCVPLNLFGGSTDVGVGTITQDQLDYVTFTAQDTQGTELRSYQANISGEVFELPAGYLAFAAGYEKRWQSGFDQPDAIIAAGITSGNSRQPTEGSFSVEEVYLELAVPLLTDLPFAKSVDLELATRYSDYSNFGDTTNSKVGLKWRVNDEVLFRGTFSEAFRAPTITELFLGNSDAFPPLNDPCNGGAAGNPGLLGCAGIPATYSQPNSQIRITQGGNQNLSAEEAESFTYGVVYSPKWAEGLSMTFDVYDIEIDNAVAGVGAQTILDACAADGTTLCSLIERNSSGGVVDLFNGLVNLGGQTTSGFDTNIAYNFETEVGDFRINWDLTYIDERTTIIVDPVSGENTEFNDAGQAGDRDVIPRVRSNLSVSWSYDDWTASYLVRFIGHTTEACDINDALEQELCSDPSAEIGGDSFNELNDLAYHDISGSYHITENIRLSVGVNNVWDTDPEVSFSTFANSFDPSLYEIPGRFVYTRVNVSF